MYFVFVELEKAFECVSKEVMWWVLKKKDIMEPEVRGVMEMYKEAETSVKLEGEMSEWFQVRVGVHQGSVLSPLHCSLQLL